MTQKFPTIRKECSFWLDATHDLKGVTMHPDAAKEHGHRWVITLIWIAEFNCKLGFQRDEASIAGSWGKRIMELDGKNLSTLMKLPATAENFAAWLLFYWLPRPSEREVNFEISGVRVTKDGHSSEIMHSATNKRAWEWFGGEVA